MARNLRWFVLGALLLGWFTPDTALAQSGAYDFVWEDFANGFTVDTPGSKWNYFRWGSFVGNNGHAWSGGTGMSVWSPGLGPGNNPAFTLTVAPDNVSGLPGGLDHVKWLAYMNHTSSQGYPGFDAQWNHELACSTRMSGQTYGAGYNPFGWSVTFPNRDLRPVSFAMNTVDFESFMVFDFMFTNEVVYAIYERLPFGRAQLGYYAAFTFAIPVASRTTSSSHQTRIAYDKRGGVVRWILDGVEVFRVSNIGYRIDRKWLIIDHGGIEQPVSVNQLNCGMGMFTLLDASEPGATRGLVRLSSTPSFYYQPQNGTTPSAFVDETSKSTSRLFGQGAQFLVGPYSVSSTLIY